MTPNELRALCERAARDKPAIWVDGWEELMAVLPSVADQIEAQAAEIKRLREALTLISTQWAGHAEACAYAKDYNARCDCDWPKARTQCEAALKETADG